MHDDIFNALLQFVREEMTVGSIGVDAGIPKGGAGLAVRIPTSKDKKKRRKRPKLLTFKEFIES